MKRGKKQKILSNIILLCLVTLICLFILEVGIRLVWEESFYGYPPGLHSADKTKGYAYTPNFQGHFPSSQFDEIGISINSKGLRDVEHSYERDEHIRILGLGDSVAFGAGVAFEETYLHQLEKKLENVEIVKAGVNGYEFVQQDVYYREEGHKYKPDVVLVGVVLNDVLDVGIDALYNQYSATQDTSYKIKNFVGRHCRLCKFVHLAIIDMRQKKELDGQDYNQVYFNRLFARWEGEDYEKYEKRLKSFSDRLKEDNVTLVLAVFPYTQQFTHSLDAGTLPQRKLKAFAETEGVEYIDLLPHLDRADFEAFYLENDNLHLNGKGYEIVAQVLSEELSSLDSLVNP